MPTFLGAVVIKGAETGMKFSWHQDSGYVNYPDHKPYLTCWCALDDMSEANGTVHLLPFSRSGIRSWVHAHRRAATTRSATSDPTPASLSKCPPATLLPLRPQLSLERYQHHEPHAPRLLGANSLRAHSIRRRVKALGQRRTPAEMESYPRFPPRQRLPHERTSWRAIAPPPKRSDASMMKTGFS